MNRIREVARKCAQTSDMDGMLLTAIDCRGNEIEESTITLQGDQFELLENTPLDWGRNYRNTERIHHPFATYDWGIVSGLKLTDSGGNVISRDRLRRSVVVGKDCALNFNKGEFEIHLP